MAKIKNINGTSDNNCGCGSWLNHYYKNGGYKYEYCCEDKCVNKDLVGAHVQKDGSTDNSWYIIPLCKAHNASTTALEIGSRTLVSANKALTCEKK